jgi:hypothetical protein
MFKRLHGPPDTHAQLKVLDCEFAIVTLTFPCRRAEVHRSHQKASRVTPLERIHLRVTPPVVCRLVFIMEQIRLFRVVPIVAEMKQRGVCLSKCFPGEPSPTPLNVADGPRLSRYLGNSGRADRQSGGSLPVRPCSRKGYDFSVRREPVKNGSFLGSPREGPVVEATARMRCL